MLQPSIACACATLRAAPEETQPVIRVSGSEYAGRRTGADSIGAFARGSRFPRAARVVAILASMVVIGVAVAVVGAAPAALVVVVSLAAIPLILSATMRAPELVVGTVVFSQILEGLELQTPLGTLSLGIVALIVFLGQILPQVLKTGSLRGYRLGTACLAAYVAGQAFQVLHGDTGLAIRQLITASSFAAFAVLGLYIGDRRSHLAAAAVGAAAALLVLAALALGSNLGVVPFVTLGPHSREILGVTSPFFRSYGLEGVTVGLLLPVCVPWLAMMTRSLSGLWLRAAFASVLALIWLASLLLFQSRSMVLEVALGALLAWSLANRTFATGVLVLGVGAGAVLVTGLLLSTSTDIVSNQLRAESYVTAVEYLINNPAVLLVGTNSEQFRLMVNESLTYSALIPAGAPTHNLLIETIVSGGVVSGLGLVALVIAPVLSTLRAARRVGRFSSHMVLVLSAVAIAVMEAMVTPSIANSAPFWVTLGFAVAVAASATQGGERDTSGRVRPHLGGLAWKPSQ
jgi:hypothetical protein